MNFFVKMAVIVGLVLEGTANAADPNLKAPDFQLKTQHSGSSLVIHAFPPSAHHFNIDAPMALTVGGGKYKPKSASPKEVSFEVPSTMNEIRVALYLCDDAKTYCEKHEVSLSGDKQISAATFAETTETVAHSSKMEHGFTVNDAEGALARAKREGKPLVIDFFGIWCPPCNELDEKVFSSPSFQDSAKRFVLLKLDADSPRSWKLKSKFHPSGYPTVVFASSEGDEISRIVGFRDRTEFLRLMDDAWKNRDAALAQLEARAEKGDRDAADRAGIIRCERGECSAAAKLLNGTKKNREYMHLAEIDAISDENVDQKVARIEQALKEFPDTPRSVEWYGKLADIYGEKKDEAKRKESLQHAIDLSMELAKNPSRLKGYDATAADLLESRAGFREDLVGKDAKALTRPDWLAAADAYRKRGLGAKERANNLEYAFCLGKAGEFAKGREIFQRLENAYPTEFTFYFYQGRMELEAQDLKSASQLFQKALDRSYGDNKLRVAKFAAETEDKLGNRAEAKKIADTALENLQLPEDRQIRTHRYADQLKKFRKTLD